jgi:hypothetical protein
MKALVPAISLLLGTVAAGQLAGTLTRPEAPP